ncbi:unnamed protein product [Mycena citricolor]|uniref:Uncharacterized protein n=1 Tax=Mycena citricolor TaxID=2018698 RepID=A0AAD2HJG0_9AGAR|nr:unnamed protein product [Mycena citricolor]
MRPRQGRSGPSWWCKREVGRCPGTPFDLGDNLGDLDHHHISSLAGTRTDGIYRAGRAPKVLNSRDNLTSCTETPSSLADVHLAVARQRRLIENTLFALLALPTMVRARCLALAFGLFSALGSNAAPTDVPSAASFYVPSIPDIHQDPNNPLTIFAGHIQADPDAAKANAKDVTSHLYFVLVKNRRVADKQRVMFWFNGGPGCSSFDGLMMEVGPWRMDGKGGFKVEEGGWEEYMTVVYGSPSSTDGLSQHAHVVSS